MALTCHKSVLFMIIMYPIIGEKFKQLKAIIRIGLLATFIILSRVGVGFIVSLYGRNDYSWRLNSGNGYKLLAYYIIIILFLLYFGRGIDSRHRERHKGLALGLIYPQILATAISIATRITKYTETYLFLLIPEVAMKKGKRNGNTFLTAAIVILSIMFFYSLLSDSFFPYFTHFSKRCS